MAKSGISDRAARRPCGLPREGQAGPPAATTILKSGGQSSGDHDVRAQTRLGDEAHGVGAAEIAPVAADREAFVIRQRRATQGALWRRGGFVELVRANGTWMNFSHPDGCPAARSAPA